MSPEESADRLSDLMEACGAFAHQIAHGFSIHPTRVVPLDVLDAVPIRLDPSAVYDWDRWCSENVLEIYELWIDMRFTPLEQLLRENGWKKNHAPMMEFRDKYKRAWKRDAEGKEWLDRLDYTLDLVEQEMREFEGVCTRVRRLVYAKSTPDQTKSTREPVWRNKKRDLEIYNKSEAGAKRDELAKEYKLSVRTIDDALAKAKAHSARQQETCRKPAVSRNSCDFFLSHYASQV